MGDILPLLTKTEKTLTKMLAETKNVKLSKKNKKELLHLFH